MGERRALESLRIGFSLVVLANIVYCLDYIINILRGRISIFLRLTFPREEIIRISFFFSLLVLGSLFLSNGNIVDEEKKIELNRKMKIFLILNIIAVINIFISWIVLKDREVILSSIAIEVYLIGITVASKKIIELKLSDRQLRWKMAVEYGSKGYSKESNFTWRYKIWFTPREKVPFGRRWTGLFMNLVTGIIYFMLLISEYSIIFSSVMLFLLLRRTLFILEGVLGLQTSITGICTGVVKQPRRSGNMSDYIVYVTDYERNHEIRFRVRDYCSVSEMQNVTVVHGVFSKRVLYVKHIELEIG